VLKARLALLSLWVSQVCRNMADNCLRIFVVLAAARLGAGAADEAWNIASALFVLPALLLAPVNGAISNSLPKRRVLIASALYCLLVVLLTNVLSGGAIGGPWWLVCLGLNAAGYALYSPARYGMLPAAAQDTRLPLPRVNGFIEMGSVTAVIAGMVVAGELFEIPSPVSVDWPTVVLGMLGLNVLCLVTALPAYFPSDLYRPERPRQALLGFFRDCRRIWATRDARGFLLGQAGLRGLVVAATGLLLATYVANQGRTPETPPPPSELVYILVLVGLGAGVGSLFAGIQAHPTRCLGQVPLAATGLVAGLLVAAVMQAVPWWLCFWFGAMAAIVNVPIFASYQAAVPADARGNAIAVINMAGYAFMTALSLVMVVLARFGLSYQTRLWMIVGVAAVGMVLAWRYLLRDTYEQALEIGFWPMYRVRGHGPGLERIPRTGPLLILANHTAWFDPCWLAAVLPRRLTGMLISTFYDKPFLNFLIRHVVPTIRVEESSFRREAPELQEAVAALDRGEAVLIFPEGQMRKREERPLHQFGRGIWHILKERPNTPVVICWIEGAWGSFASYGGGPPGKKRFDRRRPIDVAVRAPEVLDPTVLADHRETRNYLMQTCLETRRFVRLEPLQAKNPLELKGELVPEGEQT
jgi:1-acyl-sn-glycerol-3-phosphate acyltransferase